MQALGSEYRRSCFFLFWYWKEKIDYRIIWLTFDVEVTWKWKYFTFLFTLGKFASCCHTSWVQRIWKYVWLHKIATYQTLFEGRSWQHRKGLMDGPNWQGQVRLDNFEMVFWCLRFPPKNERKQVDLRYHSNKVEFVCSFFGENQ